MTHRLQRAAITALCLAGLAPACVQRSGPVAITLSQDACASCRMVFASTSTAAQIVRAGDEPLLFDDIDCLRAHLEAHALDPAAAVYVMEHRTTEWIDARHATFTRATGVATPMASGILAHRDEASRDADAAARGGATIDRLVLLGQPQEKRP
jgi:copper chaperone NosL